MTKTKINSIDEVIKYITSQERPEECVLIENHKNNKYYIENYKPRETIPITEDTFLDCFNDEERFYVDETCTNKNECWLCYCGE